MIIIYEGADGVGKTTAVSLTVEALHADGGTAVLHRGPPKVHPLLEYTLDIEIHTLADPDMHIVCDRWHWGELVYGPLFRGKTSFTTQSFAAVNEYLWQLGALVCLIDDQEQAVRARITERGDDAHVLPHLESVLGAYRDMYDSYRVGPYMPQCTKIEGIPTADTVARVIEHARRTYAVRQR